jgi:hypothetical protein
MNKMPDSSNDPSAVINYEISMYKNTSSLLSTIKIINNALTESRVLHTRILIEFLLSEGNYDDDIKLKDLEPKWAENEGLKLINRLKDAYGDNKNPEDPRCVFNKMLAHATSKRTDKFDYTPYLNKVDPIILEILDLLEKRIN